MATIQQPSKEWLDKTMTKLEVSKQEALEIWCDDHDIDVGKAKDFDLSPEKQKAIKSLTRGKASQPANYSMRNAAKKRSPRKANDLKRKIIDWFKILLDERIATQDLDRMEVTNIEKSIDLWVDGKHFTLSLVEHRAKKD